MFSLICAWTNGWVNNREARDLRRHRAHFDVNVVKTFCRSVNKGPGAGRWLLCVTDNCIDKTIYGHLGIDMGLKYCDCSLMSSGWYEGRSLGRHTTTADNCRWTVSYTDPSDDQPGWHGRDLQHRTRGRKNQLPRVSDINTNVLHHHLWLRKNNETFRH